MAAKFSRHIALTGSLAAYVESEVARGEYASVSEMVRAALRMLKERRGTSAEQVAEAVVKLEQAGLSVTS